MTRNVTPIIENTKMQALYNQENVHTAYLITPIDGYVLHATELDTPILDEQANQTGEVVLGFTRGTKTCGANYDFEENPREFYTEAVRGGEKDDG